MAEKGEVKKHVLEALKIHEEGLRWSEIKGFVEKRLESEPTDRSIHYNLTEGGFAEKRNGKWYLSERFSEQETRKTLKNLVDESEGASPFKASGLPPVFTLGSGSWVIGGVSHIENLIKARIGHELYKFMTLEGGVKRETILKATTWMLWASYLDVVETYQGLDPREIYQDGEFMGFRRVSKSVYDPPCSSLTGLLERLDGLEKQDSFSALKSIFLHCWDPDTVERQLIYEYLIEDLLSWFKGSKTSDSFLAEVKGEEGVEEKVNKQLETDDWRDFIERADNIKFAYVIPFGFEAVKGTEELILLQKFERWLGDVEEGVYDEPGWNGFEWKKGLRKVIRRIESANQRGEGARDIDPVTSDITDIDLHQPWTLEDLWKHHPRGEEKEFYEEILEVIEKAEERTRKKSD